MVKPLIEQQGKDVVLYLHSYAGFSGSSAIAGLSKAERNAKGEQGGIIGLFYQSAFGPKPGETSLAMIGAKYAPWHHQDEKAGLVRLIDPKKIFYTHVPGPLASGAANLIYGQSTLSFSSPGGLPQYHDTAYGGRRVYLRTNQDQALPPIAQDSFVTGSGVGWKILKLDTSHSPFLSVPDKLANILEEDIKDFTTSFNSVKGANPTERCG